MSRNECYSFPAVFSYTPGEEISVSFPDFDAATSGVDDRDALDSARELLLCVIQGLKEDQKPLPKPTPLSQISLSANQHACLVEVSIPA